MAASLSWDNSKVKNQTKIKNIEQRKLSLKEKKNGLVTPRGLGV